MKLKPGKDIFEYYYTRHELRRNLLIIFLLWLSIRVGRTILYINTGSFAFGNSFGYLLLFLSGLLFGLAIQTVIVYKKSVEIKG